MLGYYQVTSGNFRLLQVMAG